MRNKETIDTKDKLRKSIFDMITNIGDEQLLERIHRFVQFIYTKK